MSFAAQLLAARKRRDMTSGMLAKRSQIDATQISHYESGRREPSVDNLTALCRALDVSADFLLGLSKETRRLDQ